MRNMKGHFLSNRAFWQLDLTIVTSREFESRANCLARLEVLSYSATAGVTLQLPAYFTRVPPLVTRQSQASHEIQLRGSS